MKTKKIAQQDSPKKLTVKSVEFYLGFETEKEIDDIGSFVKEKINEVTESKEKSKEEMIAGVMKQIYAKYEGEKERSFALFIFGMMVEMKRRNPLRDLLDAIGSNDDEV